MTEKRIRTREALVTMLDEPDEVMRRQVGGFVNFMREKAVVGLAVGFIVGQQAQGLIKQLVDSFINPWLNIIVGSKLQERKAYIGDESFAWGKFVYVFINFLMVLLAIYLLIKLFKLDKLDLPKEVKPKKSK
ncbi:MscL family protein [Candidatus Saccharibacteria bacterium]|nr:MAG: MscL family protein [Candidatus Saccharibacteria bacterium]